MMILSSLWKKSLLLLALTSSTRRDVVIAFVQTTSSSFLAKQQQQQQQPSTSTTSSSTTTTCIPLLANKNSNNDDEWITAPLSKLIHLDNKNKNEKEEQEDTKQSTSVTTNNSQNNKNNNNNDNNSKNNNNNNNYQLISPIEDIIELKPKQRLVCIGDVHGDYEALQDFLEIAKVYDRNASSLDKQWIGGNTIVVQCGDVLDRGSQELKCFNLLTRLSQQASSCNNNNGAVIILWGNHEALNAGGLFHYTTGEEEYELSIGKIIDEQLCTDKWRFQYAGNQPARWATYEPGSGILSNTLLGQMKVAVRVGKTVCVHAGLTTKHLDQYGGLKGMNTIAQQYMKQVYHGKNNNLGEYESIDALVADVQRRSQIGSSRLPEVLGGGSGSDSPVWMRDYSSPNDAPPKNPKAQTMLDAVLFYLQADRMVMGHTVQTKINAALNGKAWRIDVGASRGVMNGTPEVLEVEMQDDGRTEVVSILTRKGKVPAKERLVSSAMASALSA